MHDLTGQASSKALLARVPLEDILKAAAWKTLSTFVSAYLTDTLASVCACGVGSSFRKVLPIGPPTIITVLLHADVRWETYKKGAK